MFKRILPLLLVGSFCFGRASTATAQTPSEKPYAPFMERLNWRSIGPAIMGGRIDDFAVVESNPSTFYVGTATGGLYKTTNNGTTFESIFQNQNVSSIGDVTLAPSDPNIVWVGSGEANNRQSSSWGDGVYKSTDAGKTWTHMGLKETMHIGRIVIDPRDANVVFVAANGRLWGPNKERGLFKTTDGGKTWQHVLAINEDTGVTDVVMDATNPDVLIAAAYQRRRTAFGFNGGGPGSGIYKTTDGGKTWKKITEGLPTTEMGRIGLDIYRKNPKVIYACVESLVGGVYRSDDQGDTWKKQGTIPQTTGTYRPMYFSQIRIDPNNDQRILLAGVNMGYSSDGGKTFRVEQNARIHADVHAIWIDPNNSNHTLVGCDGGIQATYDGCKTWDYINTLPLAQFYEIAYDMQKPYWVYGGLQDNGSWGAPSTTLTFRGVTNDEWIQIGGGDGFYAQVDPTDPNIIYTESQQGFVGRLNRATGERKNIRPRPPAGEPPYRFDWNTPIHISPHNPKKIFVAANHLFISTDRGDSWRRTEDLSGKPDRTKIPIMGVLPTSRTLALNDGQDNFGEIVGVSESPVKEGVLWVGTDDGNLQYSADDGKTWRNLSANVPGVPKGTYVSRVVASRYSVTRAYVCYDGHRSDDFKPYIFVTEDSGTTWKPLASNLPEFGTVHVLREHPRNPDLLFCGTEKGAYVSFDRGGEWVKFGAPLPTVPVYDIQIHPRDNDLILATHGLGVWILDDITPLEQMTRKALPNAFCLFDPVPTMAYRFFNHKANTGNRIYVAPNAPTAAVFKYYLKSVPKGEVKLTILEKDGKTVVREIPIDEPDAGVFRVFWDYRYGAATAPVAGASRPGQPAPAGGGGGGQGGRFGGGFGARGPRVLPGTYLVRLTVGKETQTATIQVADDSRIKISQGERKALFTTLRTLSQRAAANTQATRTLTDLRTQIRTLQGSASYAQAPQPLKDSVTALLNRINTLAPAPRPQAAPGAGGEGEGGAAQEAVPTTIPLATRLALLTNGLESLTEAPSAASRQEAAEIEAQVKRLVAEVNEINAKTLPALNKILEAAKLTPIKPGKAVALAMELPYGVPTEQTTDEDEERD